MMDNDVFVTVETSVHYLSIPVSHQIFVCNVKLRVPVVTHARVQTKCESRKTVDSFLLRRTYIVNDLIDVHVRAHLSFPY